MRIRYKIMLLLVFAVAAAMLISAIFSSLAIKKAFNIYFQSNELMRLEQMTAAFVNYYQKDGWNGIETVFMPGMRRGRGQGGMGMRMQFAERLIVVNKEGTVVADSLGQDVGKYYVEQGELAVPIIVSGEKVGTLVAVTRKGILEENFIDSIRLANIKAGLLATILVLGIGIYFSRRISKPLGGLSEAVRKIAKQELYYRVPVGTKDEIGELGRAFNKMAESLEHNELVRKNLIADVAHELRTPLAILRGNLEMLEEAVIKPTPEVFASLHEESIRISRIVDDLQSLSQADAGELKFDFCRADLAEIAQTVVANLQSEAAKKNIKIDVVALEPVYILIDKYRISQVLYNLISNAIRYSDQGQVAIIIKELPRFVQVQVRDNGPGISEEHLPLLFERFYRAEKSRNRNKGGSGLGLAIAKSFIEAHGGEIWAESKLGEGSSFFFLLPKKENASSKE